MKSKEKTYKTIILILCLLLTLIFGALALVFYTDSLLVNEYDNRKELIYSSESINDYEKDKQVKEQYELIQDKLILLNLEQPKINSGIADEK